MITYLIEFSLLLGFFGLVNLLIVRYSGQYEFRRNYLIITILISIMVPLVPSFTSNSLVVFSEILPSVEIITQGIESTQSYVPGEHGIPFLTIVFFLYAIVSFMLLVKFSIAAFRIYTVLKEHKVTTIDQSRIVYAAVIKNPCSFFKTILLPSERIFSADELQAIIKHENIHIALNHTIEKIFFELTKVLFWWHPVSWIYNHEIELIHELQVDEQMEQQMNPIQYKEILLQLIINPPHMRLTHSFSSNIKKRIQTMNQKKKKFNRIQLFSLCALLCLATVFIHSCAETTEGNYGEKIDDVKLVAANPYANSYELNVVDTITTFDYDTYEETVQIVESTQTIYRTPENMPVFPGCDDEVNTEELKTCSQQKLLQFIYTNITYPAEAKEKGIEGMVVVRFVVNTQGTIERRSFTRTLGYGIEETVNEMLDKMQNEIKWIPGNAEGKDVNVEYTLPVKFKLEG